MSGPTLSRARRPPHHLSDVRPVRTADVGRGALRVSVPAVGSDRSKLAGPLPPVNNPALNPGGLRARAGCDSQPAARPEASPWPPSSRRCRPHDRAGNQGRYRQARGHCAVPQRADADNRSEIFRQLGHRPTYQPGGRIAEARIEPAPHGFFGSVRGGESPFTYMTQLAVMTEFALEGLI